MTIQLYIQLLISNFKHYFNAFRVSMGNVFWIFILWYAISIFTRTYLSSSNSFFNYFSEFFSFVANKCVSKIPFLLMFILSPIFVIIIDYNNQFMDNFGRKKFHFNYNFGHFFVAFVMQLGFYINVVTVAYFLEYNNWLANSIIMGLLIFEMFDFISKTKKEI